MDEERIKEVADGGEEAMDRSAAIAAAWDEVESDEGNTEGSAPDEAAEAAAEPDADRRLPEAAEVADEPDAPEGVEPSLNPPSGLSPAAREEWANTPEPVRQHVAQFEQRMQGMAQKYGQSYQRVQQMDRVLAPYQQLFAMNGGAAQMLPGLLQTASMLQMGTPAQKAQAAANIIKQFDVDVQALDSVLVGEPAQDPQVSQLDQLLQQRLGPLQQQLQKYQMAERQREQQSNQALQGELQEFAKKNEFFNDVALDVADLMEAAANRGREMSLEEAYKVACAAHPEISKVMMARESASKANQRRAAASSISGNPSSPSGEGQMSRRELIAAAMDQAQRI